MLGSGEPQIADDFDYLECFRVFHSYTSLLQSETVQTERTRDLFIVYYNLELIFGI